MRLISHRGQEEAPIELLIAVTVLTFVLIIGFSAYESSCSSQFEQKMKSSLSGFARSLEQIYQGGVGTSYPIIVDFSPIGCASGEIDSVRLVKGGSEFCNVRLGVNECYMLAVRLQDKTLQEEMFSAEAINIPFSVKIRYITDIQQGFRCTLSRLEAAIPFGNTPNLDDTITLAECGWKMQLYTLTLRKTADGIDVVRGIS